MIDNNQENNLEENLEENLETATDLRYIEDPECDEWLRSLDNEKAPLGLTILNSILNIGSILSLAAVFMYILNISAILSTPISFGISLIVVLILNIATSFNSRIALRGVCTAKMKDRLSSNNFNAMGDMTTLDALISIAVNISYLVVLGFLALAVFLISIII